MFEYEHSGALHYADGLTVKIGGENGVSKS